MNLSLLSFFSVLFHPSPLYPAAVEKLQQSCVIVQRLDSVSPPSYLYSQVGTEADTQRNHARRTALLSPKEQDGNRRYETYIMPFCCWGQEGEKGLIKKSVQIREGGIQGQKVKPQRCIKDTCKERGATVVGFAVQRWRLCVFGGRKKESSLFDVVKSDFHMNNIYFFCAP